MSARVKVTVRVELLCEHVSGPFCDRDTLAEEIIPEIEAALDGLDVQPYDSEYTVVGLEVGAPS